MTLPCFDPSGPYALTHSFHSDLSVENLRGAILQRAMHAYFPLSTTPIKDMYLYQDQEGEWHLMTVMPFRSEGDMRGVTASSRVELAGYAAQMLHITYAGMSFFGMRHRDLKPGNILRNGNLEKGDKFVIGKTTFTLQQDVPKIEVTDFSEAEPGCMVMKDGMSVKSLTTLEIAPPEFFFDLPDKKSRTIESTRSHDSYAIGLFILGLMWTGVSPISEIISKYEGETEFVELRKRVKFAFRMQGDRWNIPTHGDICHEASEVFVAILLLMCPCDLLLSEDGVAKDLFTSRLPIPPSDLLAGEKDWFQRAQEEDCLFDFDDKEKEACLKLSESTLSKTLTGKFGEEALEFVLSFAHPVPRFRYLVQYCYYDTNSRDSEDKIPVQPLNLLTENLETEETE